jgi:hypothetical protein
MIYLTENEVSLLSRYQAEEKLLYVRYLLMREHKQDLIKDYNDYIEWLERRIAALNMMDAANGDGASGSL